MNRLVGTARLNIDRKVYADAESFRIESVDRKGNLHITEMPSAIVEAIARAFAGAKVTVDEVAPRAGQLAAENGLACTYGYKRQYFAQDCLIVLVALGRATCEKVGRGWEYGVKG